MKLPSWLDQISSRHHHSQTLYQLFRAMGALLTVFVVGTIGYHEIGDGEYPWLTCAYMAIVTVTTVGYDETIPIAGNPGAELFTILLILFGIGTFLYFVSSLTAFVIEGELIDMIWRRKLDKKIKKMQGHVIVAGVGNTGSHVLSEITASKSDCVIIDRDLEVIYGVFDEASIQAPFVEGDATDDETLISAGIERAAGVVFSLGNDRDNLFATISARRLNPTAPIVTRGEDPRSEQKFIMAGATSVIYTNVLGGMRMAAEVLRPEVTTFLDLMMVDQENYRRIEELLVPASSPLVGQRIRELGLRKHCDALIVAVWDQQRLEYQFNPGPDFVIPPDSKMIVLTLIDDVPALETLIETGKISPGSD